MRGLDLETIDEIVSVARTNPLRTALTALGVFWGTFMLLAMLGFGEGLANGAQHTIGGSVTNAVSVWGRWARMPYRGQRAGRPVRFEVEDAAAISQVPGVEVACPRAQLGGWSDGTPVTRGEAATAAQIMGDIPEVFPTLRIEMDAGRFLHARDLAERRKVAVIGRNLVEELYPDGGDPLGTSIAVNGVAFTVVGVFHSRRGDDGGDRADRTLHMPISTYQRLYNQRHIGWMSFIVAPDASAMAVEEAVRAALAERLAIHPEDRQAMGSWNAEREYERIQVLFRGIRALIWLVGLATLASGVVGVSNIMLIVVRERTAEIGLRRALGATPSSIAGMIVGEAAFLTALAGTAGLVAGTALVEGVAAVIGPGSDLGVPRIDPVAALAAFVALLVAGALAGWLPAQRALAIQPVTALRSE